MLRWLPALMGFAFLASASPATAFFPAPPVMWDSFGDPISSSVEPVTWTGNVQIVEKSDPVFLGSDLSGVDGEYFALLGNIFVDVPTTAGAYHRVRYRFAGTDAWPTALTVDLEVSASAFLGTRETVDHSGNPTTIEDLALLRSTRHVISMPGMANWRIHGWKQASLGFRATTPITRIRFRRSLDGGLSTTTALDEIVVQPGPKIDASVRRWSERNGRCRIQGTAKSDDGIRKIKVWVNSRKARTKGRERWTARMKVPAALKIQVRVLVVDKVGDTHRLSEVFLSKSR